MSAEKDSEKVLIVPTGDFSFSKAMKERYYAFPKSYGWSVPEYVAFYRTSPLSKITHLCKVKNVQKGAKLDGQYRLMTFGDSFDEEAVVVELEKPERIDNPIEPIERSCIQNAQYTTLSRLKVAEKIADL